MLPEGFPNKCQEQNVFLSFMFWSLPSFRRGAGGLWGASFSLLMLDEHLFNLLANVPGENGLWTHQTQDFSKQALATR